MIVFLASDSVLEVVEILWRHGCLTQSEVIVLSRFTERAVRKALKRLIAADVVSEHNNVMDMRFKRYRLRGREKIRGCSVAWSSSKGARPALANPSRPEGCAKSIRALGARDPSSNLGSPTSAFPLFNLFETSVFPQCPRNFYAAVFLLMCFNQRNHGSRRS